MPELTPSASTLAAPTATQPPPFIATQRAFAAHIRDPDHAPRPADVEERRMAIYRDLFFNNIASLLEPVFPVLRAILGEPRWRALVRDFMVRHRSHTPLFPELSQAFLDFLAGRVGAGYDDPPFLLELAHYEWAELALTISTADPQAVAADPDGDLLDGAPVISPLAWRLCYRWPVHRLGPAFQPAEPPPTPTCLLVWRGPDERVGFLELNPVSARLLELIDARPDASGRALLDAIAGELQHPAPAQVIAGGAALLADLRARGVVLGCRRVESWET